MVKIKGNIAYFLSVCRNDVWLCEAYLSAQDGTVGALWLTLVETQHVYEGEVAAHVRVHHKEIVRVAGQDLVTEVVDASRCA